MQISIHPDSKPSLYCCFIKFYIEIHFHPQSNEKPNSRWAYLIRVSFNFGWAQGRFSFLSPVQALAQKEKPNLRDPTQLYITFIFIIFSFVESISSPKRTFKSHFLLYKFPFLMIIDAFKVSLKLKNNIYFFNKRCCSE